MKKSLRILFTMLLALVGMNSWAQADYSTNYEGQNVPNSDRVVTAIHLTTGNGTQNVSNCQSSSNRRLFIDKTSEKFTCLAGETVKATVTCGAAWTHLYVYIDEAGDGFDYAINEADHTALEGSDLKAWTYYEGFNSLGNAVAGDVGLSTIPSFKVPETPGTYRMRFKTDWNSIDPKGDLGDGTGASSSTNNILKNRGAIIDVMIEVTAVTSIELDTREVYLGLGESFTVNAVAPGEVTWTSSDPEIATVVDGVITAGTKIGKGTATITAACGEDTKTVTVYYDSYGWSISNGTEAGTARYITSVTTTGADTNLNYTSNTAPADNHYVDALDQQLVVKPGQTITLTFTGNSDGDGLKWCMGKAWIDWNCDGALDNESELAFAAGTASQGTDAFLSGQECTFTVPEDAVAGQSRMRMVFADAWGVGPASIQPCGQTHKGFTIDFTVVIEETTPATAKLTLSYVLNENKNAATVTVEGATGNGMIAWFLNDNEDVDGVIEDEGNTFQVLAITNPSTVKVTVKELGPEDMTVYAEGEIEIDFPEVVVAELLYTVSAKYSELSFEEDGEEITLAPYVEGNAQVDVYEGFAIIHNALGIDGAELKVVYSDYDENMERNEILALELTGAGGQFIYDDEEGYYMYMNEETGMAMVVSHQWAVINQEKGNITMLVQDFAAEALSAYYLVWGEEGEQPGEDTPLFTLNGTVLSEPNAYVFEQLGLDEVENIYSMADPASNVKVDVYEEYFIIRNFMDADGVDLQCWYQVDDSDEENPETVIYKSQIVGQEFAEEDIPGNVQGSYIVVNMEGYDLGYGKCNLNPMGGWLTIIASKLSDLDNFYHYSLDFSPAIEVEKPTVNPVEGTYDELQTITITFDQAVTIPVEDWENGVYFVPQPYIENENGSESAALTAGENEGEVVFTLEKPIVKGGEYKLVLPEGCVILEDGTECPEFTFNYTITGNNHSVTTEEGETSMTITPASGSEVSVLNTFEVEFTGFINIPVWEAEAALYDAEDNEVCEAYFNDNFDGTYTIELFKKVTKAGVYTLKFTVDNQNEEWTVLGTHEYEATYTVDGSAYVELPYTVEAATTEMPDADEEAFGEFGQKMTVVVDEDNFVIKNFLGVEGFDLTAYYQVWGGDAWITSISAPGVEEPSQMIEVTPNPEIGTIGLMISYVQLDPAQGSIYVQVYTDEETQKYIFLTWPVAEEPEPESLFDENMCYTLRNKREKGYIPNTDKLTNLWGENYILATDNVEEAGHFQIVRTEGGYTIFNTDINKYLSADGTPQTAYVDEADGTFNIYPATEEGGDEGAWIIKSNVTGKWMMTSGSDQYLNNDGWSAVDDGDQWFIEPTDIPVGIGTAKASVFETSTVYNLNGQAVKNAKSGLYIVNGRKVVIK